MSCFATCFLPEIPHEERRGRRFDDSKVFAPRSREYEFNLPFEKRTGGGGGGGELRTAGGSGANGRTSERRHLEKQHSDGGPMMLRRRSSMADTAAADCGRHSGRSNFDRHAVPSKRSLKTSQAYYGLGPPQLSDPQPLQPTSSAQLNPVFDQAPDWAIALTPMDRQLQHLSKEGSSFDKMSVIDSGDDLDAAITKRFDLICASSRMSSIGSGTINLAFPASPASPPNGRTSCCGGGTGGTQRCGSGAGGTARCGSMSCDSTDAQTMSTSMGPSTELSGSVRGDSDCGTGVRGGYNSGTGIRGDSDSGTGVRGDSDSGSTHLQGGSDSICGVGGVGGGSVRGASDEGTGGHTTASRSARIDHGPFARGNSADIGSVRFVVEVYHCDGVPCSVAKVCPNPKRVGFKPAWEMEEVLH